MNKLILLVLFFSFQAQADDICIWLPNIPGCATGTTVAGHNALDVTLTGGAVVGAVDQGAPGLMTAPWWVEGTDGTNHASYTAGNSQNVNVTNVVSVTQGPNANSLLSPQQTVTSTESSLAAPANAVGIMFECESVNVDNLRWGFSNSAADILTSTLGVLCEPGRSVDYAPIGAGNYIHMISTGVGSDFMDVQWILSQ